MLICRFKYKNGTSLDYIVHSQLNIIKFKLNSKSSARSLIFLDSSFEIASCSSVVSHIECFSSTVTESESQYLLCITGDSVFLLKLLLVCNVLLDY